VILEFWVFGIAMTPSDLIVKYSQPAPRYTSYPPVPDWETDGFSEKSWHQALVQFWENDAKNEPAQVYIHLPYCESLCTFCACNKRITKNHEVEDPYIEAVLKEWDKYVELHGGPIHVSEIHLGGGTPTFFSEESLSKLMKGILSKAICSPDFEMGIEVHPGTTSTSMIRHLASLGFTRISIGIQDFSKAILAKINRFQTFEQTLELVLEARKSGFKSLNFDLVYGLPFQSLQDIQNTISKVIELDPDRIAFYGYAHVPWKSKAQRHFTEQDLPEPLQRWELFETGKSLLQEAGFFAIGMDHFAKKEDSLFKAFEEQRLNRNFMGYTDQRAQLLIGLGASAIGETPDAYSQNHPLIEDYLEHIHKNTFPVVKGHSQTGLDKVWKTHIMELMCHQTTRFIQGDENWIRACEELREMESEGLVSILKNQIQITAKGFPFLRSICHQLDPRHWAKQETNAIFSSGI
jgi:oxygen-independent coproporphyrinogen-3 oxidase